MNEAVEQLTRLLPRPVAGRPKNWASVTRQLGTELPTDYKEFIDIFGGGSVDGYLWVLEPDCANPGYDLLDSVTERAEALEYLWSSSEEKPARLTEAGARLIAWASTDNGEFAYWLARPGQHPDDWTVMINEARGECWEHFDMGFARFLRSTLTGVVTSEILTDAYPTSPHVFEPSGDFG
jgi:hypothetical protein